MHHNFENFKQYDIIYSVFTLNVNRLEEEKTQIRAKVQTEAQSQVQEEVSRILSAERALAQDSLQQTLIRERLVTENERRRAELFVSLTITTIVATVIGTECIPC